MTNERILLAHGAGGSLAHRLTEEVFLPALGNPVLGALDDSAVLEAASGRLALTTDCFVVSPLFFPGGDIGKLAICGTVNDLAMVGAVPRYLTAGFVIEEGFAISDLRRVVSSMKRAAEEAGVLVVAGDTKVVERGKADGVYITTTGAGFVGAGVSISGSRAKAGDKVILSGSIGDHGIAVLNQREGLHFGGAPESDCAPLNHLVQSVLHPAIHTLRDPTRGGLATVLNEVAAQSGVAVRIWSDAIPVREGVRAACDLLGYDPLYVANEGKLVAVVGAEEAENLVERMRRHELGREAAIIGEVLAGPPGRVTMVTAIGGTRVVDMLSGEMLPRIC